MNANGLGNSSALEPVQCGWPVNWSAVFVGSLAMLATTLILGLASIALGAQIVEHGEHVVSWNKVHFGGIVCAVASAFLAHVVGGWVAGKITNSTKAETTMLHGAIAWIVSVPIFLTLAALGAGVLFGAWYPGLAGSPAWATPTSTLPDAASILRNNALGALTALLLGLIGSVVGGWMASGQRMWFGTPVDYAESPANSSAPVNEVVTQVR